MLDAERSCGLYWKSIDPKKKDSCVPHSKASSVPTIVLAHSRLSLAICSGNKHINGDTHCLAEHRLGRIPRE